MRSSTHAAAMTHEMFTAQCMRPSAARDADVMELLYSTVSTSSPGSRMPSSMSSFRVMPPARGLPAQGSRLSSRAHQAIPSAWEVRLCLTWPLQGLWIEVASVQGKLPRAG